MSNGIADPDARIEHALQLVTDKTRAVTDRTKAWAERQNEADRAMVELSKAQSELMAALVTLQGAKAARAVQLAASVAGSFRKAMQA